MKSFTAQENDLRRALLNTRAINRGEWQAQKITDEPRHTHELMHQRLEVAIPEAVGSLQTQVQPNLPWAEDHFLERVSGEPLNPPPSNNWWPFAQNGNAEHKAGEQFSHTYPERFWPKWAGEVYKELPGGKSWGSLSEAHSGIRFGYGDLNDLVAILKRNPLTRQAYLPVWFPEDLAAAKQEERVPCTLGYHFLMNPNGSMDITYAIRSCDFVRHFRDDVYMAGRLLQWVLGKINADVNPFDDDPWAAGKLIMNIGSLHCFVGDRYKLEQDMKEADTQTWGNLSSMF